MKEHGIGAIRSSEYIGENNVRDDVIALYGYINRSPWKLTIPISAIEETYCSRKQLGCLLACDSDCTGLFHVDTWHGWESIIITIGLIEYLPSSFRLSQAPEKYPNHLTEPLPHPIN